MAIAPFELPFADYEEPLENPWPRPVLRLVATEFSAPARATEPVAGAREPPVRAGAQAATAGHRRQASVQRRRRRLALGTLLVGALVALTLPVSAIGGRPAAPSGNALAGVGPSRTAEAVYIVRPGDTLASIATRIDPRNRAAAGALATAIESELGTSSVSAGEQIVLP